ncbi:hypothetical protein [Brevibacillus sp. HD3.3A]|uniref:hypothetical protein n=1 Tax=Brevibacillus sp. HD3.3A TaxID=2738979 RepID=UPI001E5296A1|nr:hypothetical protein [Brevibacillus sp. HD3.3A]UED72160.1 hypothetical protein HP435_29075 [Brevibacillus sp. HD3.3A]
MMRHTTKRILDRRRTSKGGTALDYKTWGGVGIWSSISVGDSTESRNGTVDIVITEWST